MGQNLSGRVVLITGSTSGIGLAAARHCARAGAAAVVLNGRSEESGRKALELLSQESPGTRSAFIAADMRSEPELQELFNKVERDLGGADCLVHNGMGAGPPDVFENHSVEFCANTVNGLYLSLVHACRHAVPSMKARGGGSIIAVSSDAARVPTPGETVIGGSLAAGVMFMKTLALEVGRYKIRCNVVTPSLVLETGSHDRVMNHPFSRKIFERIEKKAQLGLPTADDVAKLVTFLAGDDSTFITGQVVSINGGVSVA